MHFKIKHVYSFLTILLIAAVTIGFSREKNAKNISITSKETGTSKITSEEAFDKMMAVLSHKRCINCHPSGDRPRQGEDSHIHNFGVQRGADNHGLAVLKCQTCHQKENNNYAGVPGAPHWHLAPKSMAWEGLSRIEIAKSMMNPEQNGGRSLDEIVKHLTEDELVLWAWNPGVNHEGIPREKPPVPKEEFIAAVKSWAAQGAIIPKQ